MWLYLRTGDELHRTLARRWTRIMAALLAVGVITGVPIVIAARRVPVGNAAGGLFSSWGLVSTSAAAGMCRSAWSWSSWSE